MGTYRALASSVASIITIVLISLALVPVVHAVQKLDPACSENGKPAREGKSCGQKNVNGGLVNLVCHSGVCDEGQTYKDKAAGDKATTEALDKEKTMQSAKNAAADANGEGSSGSVTTDDSGRASSQKDGANEAGSEQSSQPKGGNMNGGMGTNPIGTAGIQGQQGSQSGASKNTLPGSQSQSQAIQGAYGAQGAAKTAGYPTESSSQVSKNSIQNWTQLGTTPQTAALQQGSVRSTQNFLVENSLKNSGVSLVPASSFSGAAPIPRIGASSAFGPQSPSWTGSNDNMFGADTSGTVPGTDMTEQQMSAANEAAYSDAMGGARYDPSADNTSNISGFVSEDESRSLTSYSDESGNLSGEVKRMYDAWGEGRIFDVRPTEDLSGSGGGFWMVPNALLNGFESMTGIGSLNSGVGSYSGSGSSFSPQFDSPGVSGYGSGVGGATFGSINQTPSFSQSGSWGASQPYGSSLAGNGLQKAAALPGNISGVYQPTGVGLGQNPSSILPSGVAGVSIAPPANLTPQQQAAWASEYNKAFTACGGGVACVGQAQTQANAAVGQQIGNTDAVAGYISSSCDGFGSCAVQVAQGAWSKTTSFAQGLWDGISPDSVAGNAGEQQSMDGQENGDAPLGGEQKFLSGADGIAVASGDGLLPTASLKGNVSFYTPGAGGDNGGLLGNKGEYLPDNPDIAARLGSTYKQNEVLVVQRLDEDGHPVGDPRAVRIADSGYHPGRVLDLQRSVAEEIGFDMEKGVEKMQITSYGVASSPKSAQAMVDTLNSSFTGYELGSLDQPAATDNLVGLDTFPTNAPIADRIAATRQESIDLVTAAAPQVAPVSYDTPLPATSIPSPVLADVSPRFDSSYDAFNDERAALPEVLVDRTGAGSEVAGDVTSSAIPRALTDVGPSPDVLQLASLRSPSYVLSGGFTAAFSGHDVMEGGNSDYSDIAGGAGPAALNGGQSTIDTYRSYAADDMGYGATLALQLEAGGLQQIIPSTVMAGGGEDLETSADTVGGQRSDGLPSANVDGDYGALDPKPEPRGYSQSVPPPSDASPAFPSRNEQSAAYQAQQADRAERAAARADEARVAAEIARDRSASRESRTSTRDVGAGNQGTLNRVNPDIAANEQQGQPGTPSGPRPQSTMNKPNETISTNEQKGLAGVQSGDAKTKDVATPPAGAGPTAAPVVPPAGAAPGARTGSGDPSGGKDTQGDKGGAGDIAGMLKSVMDMAKGLMGGGGGKGSGGGAPAPTTPVTANPATVLATPVPSTQFAAAVPLTAAPKILVVANPNPVVSGTASTISWQAQWDDVQASSTTRECAVADVHGKTLADHAGVSDSIATPALTRAAYFVIGCKQSGGKLGSTMILIKVAGDPVAAEAPPKSLPRYETTNGLSTAGADLAAALYGSTASTGSVPASNTAEPQQQAKNMACDPNSQQYFECLTTKMQYVDKLY